VSRRHRSVSACTEFHPCRDCSRFARKKARLGEPYRAKYRAGIGATHVVKRSEPGDRFAGLISSHWSRDLKENPRQRESGRRGCQSNRPQHSIPRLPSASHSARIVSCSTASGGWRRHQIAGAASASGLLNNPVRPQASVASASGRRLVAGVGGAGVFSLSKWALRHEMSLMRRRRATASRGPPPRSRAHHLPLPDLRVPLRRRR